jgi:hypothetical protein
MFTVATTPARRSGLKHLARPRRHHFAYTVCASSGVDVAELKRYGSGLPSAGVYHGTMNRALVLGGGGFIGGHLATRLDQPGPGT